MTSTEFSPATIGALRLADRRLRGSERGGDIYRYAVCRATLTALTRVDSFYIAFFRGEWEIVFPYLFDGGEYQQPDIGAYGPRGLSQWIKLSRKTYRYRDDRGALMSRGLPFGRAEAITHDTVVTPLIDPDTSEVTGLMSIGATEPDVYTDEIVAVMEWLARALVRAIRRDREDADPLDLYTLYPELDSRRIRDDTDLAVQVTTRMAEMHLAVSELARRIRQAGQPELASEAAEVLRLCERMQSEVADLVRQERPAGPDPASALTRREAEIAELIAAQHLSNAELASELQISEKTVKTHVSNILRKLAVTQRSAIGWVLSSSPLPPKL